MNGSANGDTEVYATRIKTNDGIENEISAWRDFYFGGVGNGSTQTGSLF